MKKIEIAPLPKYYDSVAPEYDQLFTDSLSKAENNIVQRDLETILKKFDKKIRILDLGCGTGLGLELILKIVKNVPLAFEYIGVDISPRMIEIAKNKFDQENVVFYVADVNDMSNFITENKFDLVLSLFGSFSHVENSSKALNDMLKILGKTGVFYLMVYSRYSIKNFYIFLKTLNIRNFSFKRQYSIRNSDQVISCAAYFYSPKRIKDIVQSAHNFKFTFKTINGIFEIPYIKKLAKQLTLKKIFAILVTERRLLSYVPGLGHSLIAIIENKDHE